jgi:hypothetical protein
MVDFERRLAPIGGLLIYSIRKSTMNVLESFSHHKAGSHRLWRSG